MQIMALRVRATLHIATIDDRSMQEGRSSPSLADLLDDSVGIARAIFEEVHLEAYRASMHSRRIGRTHVLVLTRLT